MATAAELVAKLIGLVEARQELWGSPTSASLCLGKLRVFLRHIEDALARGETALTEINYYNPFMRTYITRGFRQCHAFPACHREVGKVYLELRERVELAAGVKRRAARRTARRSPATASQ